MRYLKTTVALGILVTLALAGVAAGGGFARADRALAGWFGMEPAAQVAWSWGQMTVSALLGFAIVWTTIDVGSNSRRVLIAAGALSQIFSASWILSLYGVFFPPFQSAAAVSAAFVAALLYSRGEAGQRKVRVGELFGGRVSKTTFEKLVNSAHSLRYDGEKREVTVLVCEIFNHAALCEALPAADYVAINNAFLENASEFLAEHGGYLDHCDGERLRVFFGIPFKGGQHAIAACEAALALARRLDAVNRECDSIWKRTFDFRIGINSGEVVLAAFGTSRLASLSAAGEPVEFARRLCAANTIYGSRILIGSSTFAPAEQALEVRPMELIQRYDHEQSREEVYELLAMRNGLGKEECERRDHFWKAIVYYRERRWDEALSLFQKALQPEVPDGPVEFYVHRVGQLRQATAAADKERS